MAKKNKGGNAQVDPALAALAQNILAGGTAGFGQALVARDRAVVQQGSAAVTAALVGAHNMRLAPLQLTDKQMRALGLQPVEGTALAATDPATQAAAQATQQAAATQATTTAQPATRTSLAFGKFSPTALLGGLAGAVVFYILYNAFVIPNAHGHWATAHNPGIIFLLVAIAGISTYAIICNKAPATTQAAPPQINVYPQSVVQPAHVPAQQPSPAAAQSGVNQIPAVRPATVSQVPQQHP